MDKIIIVIDTITISLFLFLRVYSFNWLIKNRNKFLTDIDDSYKKLGIFLPFRSFISFTASGTYLTAMTSAYTLYYDKNPSNLLCSLTWTILFVTTVAYYIFLFPYSLKPGYPFNFYTDIVGHGPLFILFSVRSFYVENYFEWINLPKVLLFPYFWLFFIWFPWYKITGDAVYPFFKDENSLKNKISIIFKATCLGIIGFTTAKLLIY